MKDVNVHIEIYIDLTTHIKEIKDKKFLIKEFDDDDGCILISNYLFQECIFDYENIKTNETRMISYDNLKTRFLKMKNEIKLPAHLEYKIRSILNLVKKYQEKGTYYGIKVIY